MTISYLGYFNIGKHIAQEMAVSAIMNDIFIAIFQVCFHIPVHDGCLDSLEDARHPCLAFYHPP